MPGSQRMGDETIHQPVQYQGSAERQLNVLPLTIGINFRRNV